MKIEKIVKKKNSLYEIIFTNKDKINLYDDVILKYELLLKKDIDSKKLQEILKYNSYLECYNKALKYINVKLRTEKEIRKKLHEYNKDAIEYTIEKLQKDGFLNNQLYIKSYVNDEINFKLNGPLKILRNLKTLGFNEEEINNYLNTIDKDIWLNKIKKYINKKISSNHNLSAYILKNKLINDLQNNGFYKDDIYSIINEFTFVDDDSIYEKEYQKQKNKLSRKYTGEELEYRIKINMLKKGFKKN